MGGLWVSPLSKFDEVSVVSIDSHVLHPTMHQGGQARAVEGAAVSDTGSVVTGRQGQAGKLVLRVAHTY